MCRIERREGALPSDGAPPLVGVGDEQPEGALAEARSDQHWRAEALHLGDGLGSTQADGNLLPQRATVGRLGRVGLPLNDLPRP